MHICIQARSIFIPVFWVQYLPKLVLNAAIIFSFLNIHSPLKSLPAFSLLQISLCLLLSFTPQVFATAGSLKTGRFINNKQSLKASTDSLPKTNDVTVVIPFEYKRSTLYAPSLFRLMDSVAEILQHNDSITFSIFGYSYFDEGNDYVCYWLSNNRALAVKTYIAGRGIDSNRIVNLEARGSRHSILRQAKQQPIAFNCTAEIILKYPVPSLLPPKADADADGIPDAEDSCASQYGYPELNGCPDKNAIIVPFEPGQSSLFSATYKVMDSIISILRKNHSIKISIEGHAYKSEGVESLTDRLARERAVMVRRYLLSRLISPQRIKELKSLGKTRPLNAGRNPREIARNSRAEIYLFYSPVN